MSEVEDRMYYELCREALARLGMTLKEVLEEGDGFVALATDDAGLLFSRVGSSTMEALENLVAGCRAVADSRARRKQLD